MILAPAEMWLFGRVVVGACNCLCTSWHPELLEVCSEIGTQRISEDGSIEDVRERFVEPLCYPCAVAIAIREASTRRTKTLAGYAK